MKGEQRRRKGLVGFSRLIADFLRLVPTPASSDEVGRSAVNRRVASSNLARGAKYLPHLLLTTRLLRTEFLLRKVGQVGQFQEAGSAV
jgi:hypothetical protein